MTIYTAEQLAGMGDDELRRVIAEALGWADFTLKDTRSGNYDVTDLAACPPGKDEAELLPEWSTDANAAWKLPVGDWYLYVCKSDGQLARVHIVNPEADSVDRAMESEIKVDADSPARAICEAWVLWKQARP